MAGPRGARNRGRTATPQRTTPPKASPALRHAALCIGLTALTYALLPIAEDFRPLVFGSLVCRGLVAGCVAGLLRVSLRSRWAPPALATGGALAGFVVLVLLDRMYLDLGGLAAGLFLAATASWLLATIGSLESGRLVAQVAALVAVLLVALWFSGFLGGPMRATLRVQESRLAKVPEPKQYGFDGAVYLRTYYLLKGGTHYYQAFQQSVADDTRFHDESLKSVLNFREPLVFEMWRFLPGSTGADVRRWFILWSLLTMVAAYLLASRLVEPGAALLAPVALIRFYFFFWWVSGWFLFAEVWAAGFGVAALAALANRQRVASLVLLALAVAARELMVVLVPAWLLVWWLSGSRARRTSWWFPAAAVFGPAILLTSHAVSALHHTAGGSASGIGTWLNGGWSGLLTALSFGWSMPDAAGSPVPAAVPLLIAVAALAGAALARPRWLAGALLVATAVPTVFLLVFSGGQYGYYWGAFYTPLAAAVAPGVLGRLLPNGEHADA